MNLTITLETRVLKARRWLSQVSRDGAFPPHYDLTGAAADVPATPLATAAAAHLYAWLFQATGRNEDRRAGLAAAGWLSNLIRSTGSLPVDGPDGPFVNFQDLGIAGRALFAFGKVFTRTDCSDLAVLLAAQMRSFAGALWIESLDPARGYYVPALLYSEGAFRVGAGDAVATSACRKAAVLWKLTKNLPDYDELDARWFFDPAPAAGGESPDDQYAVAVRAIEYSLSAEALLIGELSGDRALAAIAALDALLAVSRLYFCRQVAQLLRLQIYAGLQLKMSLVTQLLDLQHDDGGFHEHVDGGERSPYLDVVGTVFAIQALTLAQQTQGHPGPRFPGILGRRELAIV